MFVSLFAKTDWRRASQPTLACRWRSAGVALALRTRPRCTFAPNMLAKRTTRGPGGHHGGVRARVRLLGPVDVLVDGDTRPVPGLRRKAVLAVLALQPGTVVASDRIVDIVWGAAGPVGPTALQTHLSYLRRVLGDR